MIEISVVTFRRSWFNLKRNNPLRGFTKLITRRDPPWGPQVAVRVFRHRDIHVRARDDKIAFFALSRYDDYNDDDDNNNYKFAHTRSYAAHPRRLLHYIESYCNGRAGRVVGRRRWRFSLSFSQSLSLGRRSSGPRTPKSFEYVYRYRTETKFLIDLKSSPLACRDSG